MTLPVNDTSCVGLCTVTDTIAEVADTMFACAPASVTLLIPSPLSKLWPLMLTLVPNCPDEGEILLTDPGV